MSFGGLFYATYKKGAFLMNAIKLNIAPFYQIDRSLD